MILVIIYKASAVSVHEDNIARLTEVGTDNCKDGVCKDQVFKEGQMCRLIHVKDCTITMRKVVTPVTVKRCLARKMVEDARECIGEVRHKCSVR